MITIYGASDDLIEIEGDIREEFYLVGDEEENYLAFSDGTILRIQYDGIWRIQPLVRGLASYSKTEGTDEEDDYTDRVTLDGKIEWVVQGTKYARRLRC